VSDHGNDIPVQITRQRKINLSHLFTDRSLGSLNAKNLQQSCIGLASWFTVLNSFISKRLTTKSTNLMSDLGKDFAVTVARFLVKLFKALWKLHQNL